MTTKKLEAIEHLEKAAKIVEELEDETIVRHMALVKIFESIAWISSEKYQKKK